MNGMREAEERYEPHLLKVCKLVQKGWEEVSKMTMYTCWVNSNVIPKAMSDALNVEYGGMTIMSRSTEVQRFVEDPQSLSLTIDYRDLFFKRVPEFLSSF